MSNQMKTSSEQAVYTYTSSEVIGRNKLGNNQLSLWGYNLFVKIIKSHTSINDKTLSIHT